MIEFLKQLIGELVGLLILPIIFFIVFFLDFSSLSNNSAEEIIKSEEFQQIARYFQANQGVKRLYFRHYSDEPFLLGGKMDYRYLDHVQ